MDLLEITVQMVLFPFLFKFQLCLGDSDAATSPLFLIVRRCSFMFGVTADFPLEK